MIKDFLRANSEAMLKDLSELVSYRSVFSEDEPPFGSENRKVLAAALKQMERVGLKSVNLDNYCGYGQIGAGEEIVGILAHLDVVPEGDGWDSDPYVLTQKGDKLYGRGVSDDKGAVIGVLYALKYLIESGYEFKKRVRLIVGCNEETGSRCIKHYVEKEGPITMGFTPDANFPGIFAEKGILGGTIRAKSDKIVAIKGGTVSNVVCKEVLAKIEKGSFDAKILKDYFKDNDLEYSIVDVDGYTIVDVLGKAAHASTPDLGKNAINHLFLGLYQAGLDDELVRYFYERIRLDNHGSLFGCDKLADEYSDLTMNLGVINGDADKIEISVDIRFPVTRSLAEVKEVVMKGLNYKAVSFSEDGRGANPLFFDTETPFVKALKRAYEKVTGDDKTPMECIGGGTYAKAIGNCIAFGCEFIGNDNHIHDANESLNLEDLYRQIAIYIEAIKNLCEV